MEDLLGEQVKVHIGYRKHPGPPGVVRHSSNYAPLPQAIYMGKSTRRAGSSDAVVPSAPHQVVIRKINGMK
jgi:hypothetical protein